METNESNTASLDGAEPAPGRIEHSLDQGPVEIRARGDAMSPLVRPGDRVRLQRRDPQAGEVALIAVGGRLVLHRLVRRRGDTWLVQADRPSAPDAWVHACQIIAIATDRLRAGDEHWTPLASERRLGRALRDALLGAPQPR